MKFSKRWWWGRPTWTCTANCVNKLKGEGEQLMGVESNWAWANQYLEVVRVTQMMHCPWLEIFLHIFVVMIFSIDGRWPFYINKFTFFISIHFCQGFFFANLSNFECSLGGNEMFVQDVMCLFRNISNQWTPFFWGGITFMFFHQIRQFKWLWMPLKVKQKFSLAP
jgi:hypothetical protein